MTRSTGHRNGALIALTLLCGLALGGVAGALVSTHVFRALEYVGDGGTRFAPQPLAVLFAGLVAVVAFVATLAAGVAGVCPAVLALARPWRVGRMGDECVDPFDLASHADSSLRA